MPPPGCCGTIWTPRALAPFDLVYLSGITLSIYDDAARDRLFAALAAGKARLAFDTNFRPRGWPDLAVAHQLYRRMFELADIVLASAEDLRLLFGDSGQAELLRHAPGREIVLKLDEPASRVVAAGLDAVVQAGPVAHVVDTTAAGDSFSAAYLAARLRGSDPVQAARAGHALAGVIVGHPGAIIPRGAMPTFPLETLS